MIAVPIAVYFLALSKLPDDTKNDDGDDDDDDHHFFDNNNFDKYWKARLISFSTWIVIMFLVWTPLRVWKGHVRPVLLSFFIPENEP